LKYTVLEYTHSGAALEQEWGSRLLGISLDLPSVYLNASEPFSPPSSLDIPQSSAVNPVKGPTSFLWQAPNSNAVLFLGEKWVEMHSFVSKLLEIQPETRPVPSFFSKKFISKRYPAWLEHALSLSRARGYWTLYPSTLTASNVATVHNELWQPPEERDGSDLTKDSTELTETTLASGPLIDSLPNGGTLPTFSDMPLLLWDGTVSSLASLDQTASDYTKEFRQAVGGCDELIPANLVPQRSTRDLFCQKTG
jgi:hypothetical protein